ncbi:ABC transporter substrate binding protein [Desulfovibrio gilichinskyi]|uniref:histidine kinase n=1 Tax=Desulfovibrio gilichinskyi TaxID=1519643 RepID=A0A1X7D6H6_9BACT|nr:ABC transporter substrate binding protein [Desulfovibrio gilichinskyi]SMF09768.1 PAS domain S-box-containing protein [Desulfovibrio gilichinskyi]
MNNFFIITSRIKNFTFHYSQILRCSTVIFFTLLTALSAPAYAAETKHVLVLHSYHAGMSWVSNIDKAIRDTLLTPPFENLILHIEYMDTKRNHSDGYYLKLEELYKDKYQNTPISLILTSDTNAFDFMRKNGPIIFPNIPVIFCGINDFSDEMLSGTSNFTGVAEITSSKDTVETILNQLPATKEIFVVNDDLKSGRACQANIAKNLMPFKNKVSIKYNTNMSINELKNKIQSLKQGSVVLLGVYFSDREDRYFTFEKLGSMLTQDSPVPVYCLYRFNLIDGVIGGKVISGYRQGVTMSKIARRVLSGEAPKYIPVVKTGTNSFIFDWKAMRKHNIPLSTLPSESTLINKPFSFYQEYHWLVWLALLIFATLSILIFVLTKKIIELRLLRKILSISELKYRSIFDNATEGLFQVTREGKLISANYALAAMFGYESPKDMIASVNNVVKDMHAVDSDRKKILETLDEYGKITNLEFRMKRKDNTEIFVCMNARETTTQDSMIIHEGSVIDVSERKHDADNLLKEKEKVENINKALQVSMAHLRILLETMPELVWFKDTNGVYVFCNQRFERLYGASEAEIVGKTDYDFVDKDLADFFRAHDLKAMNAKIPSVNEETLTYNSDGHTEDLETIKTPILDADGNLSGVLGMARDITERKQALKELDKLRSYLSNIIDSMPSMLVGVDYEGKVILWNRTAEITTGVSPQSAQGKFLINVQPRMKSVMESVKESLKSRKPKKEQRVPYLVNGKTRYEDIIIYPLITNVIEGAVIRIDDVTERFNLEQLMVQSEKMMSVGGLAAGMAHEINNPLAAILGSAQNLKNRLSKNSQKNIEIANECEVSFENIKKYAEARNCMKLIAGIHQSGLRAANIVQDMLSFSRKSEKQLSYHNLRDLLESSLKLVMNDYNIKNNYDFKQIKIIRDYDPVIPEIQCDGNEIQQVLLNLLKNGAEAMSEKIYVGENPQFLLKLHKSGDMAFIEITDNGPGMNEETRKRILEPFYTTKPAGQGTGLGLSVSYFIITDRHKGSMEVFSEQGKWTSFVIKLPYKA